ncbi:hypothetical protein ACSQ76_08245 [Roseovarius sp. B08]|uniref:hypothetical protein n=1 Tax=Roseovarius sp. B08 TaxID=3449223 RepID=UPI003EDB9FCF
MNLRLYRQTLLQKRAAGMHCATARSTGMASILDENPGGAGSFNDGKLSKAQINRRRAHRERWERAMALRQDWTDEQHAEESERLKREVEELLEQRRAA